MAVYTRWTQTLISRVRDRESWMAQSFWLISFIPTSSNGKVRQKHFAGSNSPTRFARTPSSLVFLRVQIERQRTNHLRFLLQSAKTEELLKLWRELWLRTGGRKRKLLVRGAATRLLGCWCGSRLPLSRVFKRSNCETAQAGCEPFDLDPLHYDFAAYAGRR